jgi:glycosyltransferase involved in cell wall biosynthesis
VKIYDQRVSVIIPAYNAQQSLRLSIDSAIKQDLQPFEVIVINDGSTDQTSNTAKSYGDKVIYVEQENRGQGAARNRGLELASGDYVAFLDADDFWLKNFLRTCISFLVENTDAVAVSTGLILKMANGKELILPECITGKGGVNNAMVIEDFFPFWAEHDHIRTGSNVIRRSIIELAGFQREDLRISQDLEYWAYIATFGKWGFIPIPLWVGNSRSEAKQSWIEKYRKRRHLCPTVESWEKRIIPRLKANEIVPFQKIRGRVAASFAHNKILAGNFSEALKIVKNYERSMPKNRLTVLLKMGANCGTIGWLLICNLVRLREIIKSWKLKVS